MCLSTFCDRAYGVILISCYIMLHPIDFIVFIVIKITVSNARNTPCELAVVHIIQTRHTSSPIDYYCFFNGSTVLIYCVVKTTACSTAYYMFSTLSAGNCFHFDICISCRLLTTRKYSVNPVCEDYTR